MRKPSPDNNRYNRPGVSGLIDCWLAMGHPCGIICVWTFFILCSCGGCTGSQATSENRHPDNAEPNAAEFAKTEIERGPVKVRVKIEPQPARLSDEPVLTLTMDCQQGVQIEKPPFGEAIGDFVIRDYRETLPEVVNDREVVHQIYTLEPTRTGTLQIAPIAVAFIDNRPDGDGEKHKIETEAITIEIQSVLESEAPSLDDLQGLTGPLELPVDGGSLATWLVGLLVLVAIVVTIMIWFTRRGPESDETTSLSPQELAFLGLQRLVQKNLSETDVKLFYVQLTGIVRRYIELTTKINAPEQTTEEFLREISSGTAFPPEHQQRLQSFLESADFVKFAAHRPTADDIEQAFVRAKAFVGLEDGAPIPTEAVTR